MMQKRSTRQILEQNQKRSSPLRKSFILWLHDIRSLHNVGSVFRSADAFGIRELWISGFTPSPPRPEITKTALGAEEHVAWKNIRKTETGVRALKSAGYSLIGLEQTDQSTLIHEFQPGRSDAKICLVLGNEVTGIGEDLLPFLDGAVEIPQFGMKHSLNVSVAAGVALYAFFEKFLQQSKTP